MSLGVGPEVERLPPTEADFPILGESFAVEFANSLYRDGDSVMDFLHTTKLVVGWFDAVGGNFVVPARLTVTTASALRDLRNALRQLFDDMIDGAEQASPVSIATLNRLAKRAPSHLHLEWPAGSAPQAGLRPEGGAADALVVGVASECIAFLAGPDREHLRRCDHPGCYMVFVQQHHRRRYCNDGCASSDRQSRYYRRGIKNRSAKGHVPAPHQSIDRQGSTP
jgi:predicted RNA-binding Zn ribbon-like protein